MKRVKPAMETEFEKRREASTRILLTHFPNASDQSISDYAHLVASGITIWGDVVPTLKSTQKSALARIIKELENLSSDAPIWLKKELKAAQAILTSASSAQTLHGRQHSNEMENKAQLVNICRQVWIGQYKKEPPVSFQQETHPFSLFVGDVISQVHLLDWSPKSAIQAYENLK